MNFNLIIRALDSLTPGVKVIVKGDSYEDIEWLDSSKMPTEKQIENEIKKILLEEQKDLKNKEIFEKLDNLDFKLIRPLAEKDEQRIADINKQKEELRKQIEV